MKAADQFELDASSRSTSAGSIFLLFLGIGLRAFGGPAAQIAELRAEFVDRRRWLAAERFHRALAVYQLLPGPEAHELCCYLGALRGGRLGSVAAGLGFMLPGLVLMLGVCAIYAKLDFAAPSLACAMAAMQLGAAALIVRAAWRLGKPVVASGPLHAIVLLLSLMLALWWFTPTRDATTPLVAEVARGSIAISTLFGHGLAAGLVTFGGAYTAIPYITEISTGANGWMTREEILNGVAIASVLPAPLVIFCTFAGFLGAGFAGALASTAGIFLPAFSFTLVGFSSIERLLAWKSARTVLDFAGAIAIGLMAGAALPIALEPLRSGSGQAVPLGLATPVVFLVLLLAVFRSKSRLAVPVLIVTAGALGALYGFLAH